MEKNFIVLSSYDTDWVFTSFFPRIVALCTTAITVETVGRDRVEVQLSPEGYKAMEANCPFFKSLCTVKILDFTAFRAALGYTEFYAYPKFIGLTTVQGPVFYRDLDVALVNIDDILAENKTNWFSLYEMPELVRKEQFGIDCFFREKSKHCVDGALFYIGNGKEARDLGRNLGYICSAYTGLCRVQQNRRTVLENEWMLLEEANILGLVKEDYRIFDKKKVGMYINYGEQNIKKQTQIFESLLSRLKNRETVKNIQEIWNLRKIN